MNQEKRERNKNNAFPQELGHIKHNEIFKNQNEKIFLEQCKFKFMYKIQVVYLLRISGLSLSSNGLPVMKAEVIGKLGLFQTSLNHVCTVQRVLVVRHGSDTPNTSLAGFVRILWTGRNREIGHFTAASCKRAYLGRRSDQPP